MKETALITGASGGIGEEMARELARRGFSLVLVARSRDKLEALASELSSATVSVKVIAMDLEKPNAALDLVEELSKQSIQVDLLVNNAGFGDTGLFAESDLSKYLSMIQLNVAALTELCHYLLKPMIARKRGRILNVASTAGFIPGPFMSVYHATKNYVLAFSEGLREELSGSGVSVTVLCPGPMVSGFQQAANLDLEQIRKNPLITDVKYVAQQGINAVLANKAMVIPGTLNQLQTFIIRFSPRVLVPKVVRKVYGK